MTAKDIDERKNIGRLQNLVVIVMFLLLSSYVIRALLIDEPQRWQDTEKAVALSTFSETVGLTRAEWLRQGKPSSVALFERVDAPARFIKVNRKGWPSADNDCLALWRKLGGEIPVDALSAKQENQRCHFSIDGAPWFLFDSDQGRIWREKDR